MSNMIDKLNQLEKSVEHRLNAGKQPLKYGFVLFVFPFGAPLSSTPIGYRGNAEKRDLLQGMRQVVAQWEKDLADEEPQ